MECQQCVRWCVKPTEKEPALSVQLHTIPNVAVTCSRGKKRASQTFFCLESALLTSSERFINSLARSLPGLTMNSWWLTTSSYTVCLVHSFSHFSRWQIHTIPLSSILSHWPCFLFHWENKDNRGASTSFHLPPLASVPTHTVHLLLR